MDSERTSAWEFIRTRFLYKPLSKDIGWWHTLGSLCLFLFIVQIITGIVLACNYVPTLERAYCCVEYIQQEMAWGWLIRGIHHWASHLLLVSVCIHMGRVFFHGSYKQPNEVTWVAGVFLLILTTLMALTGYILPWSDRSYWAATILAKVFEFLPVVGIWLVNLVGGTQAGGITISRYFAFHVTLLPLSLGFVLLIHLFLIQIHGEMGPPPKAGRDIGTQPFYPYQLAKDVVVSFLVLVALVLLARFAGVPHDAPAVPLTPIHSVPKPEWFILFGYEVLKMFKGKSIIIALTVVPIVGLSLALLLPYYDKNPERAYTKRPIAISCGISLIVLLLYLTLIAYVSSPLPGKFFAPDRPLTVKELAGIALFEKNVCYSCHSVKGVGMKNAPDLWKVGIKRDADYFRDLLKNPDKTLGKKGKMVSYHIDASDIEALVSYLSSLNLMRYEPKMVEPAVFRNAYIIYRKNIQAADAD